MCQICSNILISISGIFARLDGRSKRRPYMESHQFLNQLCQEITVYQILCIDHEYAEFIIDNECTQGSCVSTRRTTKIQLKDQKIKDKLNVAITQEKTFQIDDSSQTFISVEQLSMIALMWQHVGKVYNLCNPLQLPHYQLKLHKNNEHLSRSTSSASSDVTEKRPFCKIPAF